MKIENRIVGWGLRFVSLYIVLVLVFVLAKAYFLLEQPSVVRSQVELVDLLQAMWHGLPLDLATTGYLTAPVWLCLELALWMGGRYWGRVYKVYAAVVSIALALIYVGDAYLYRFWNVKLDSTVWNYLSQPQGALQSMSMHLALMAVLTIIFVAIAFYYLQVWTFLGRFQARLSQKNELSSSLISRIIASVVWLIAGGLMFLGIRGGVGKSTANVGMVYFSNRTILNHIAVNPAFSLISSSFKTRDFSKEARFFEEP